MNVPSDGACRLGKFPIETTEQIDTTFSTNIPWDSERVAIGELSM
jgi:hypothetical protein